MAGFHDQAVMLAPNAGPARSPGRARAVGKLRFAAWLLAGVLGGTAAVAQPQPPAADPLKSPACGEATQALEAARAAAGTQGQRAPRVEQLRREAARICLGAGAVATDGKPPSRVARQPDAVPAPAIAVPRAAAAPPHAPSPMPGPVQIARPQALSQCDAGGCWDANGTRLNRAGPNLIGPAGSCSVQGSFANCP